MQEIYLYNRNIDTNGYSRHKIEIIKELAGLELLIQKGIKGQWIINRLKELAEKMK